MAHEWVILANLLGLLLGFALLSNHFERSKVPEVLPHYLPDDWKGGFVLLVIVFVLSSFLDNIAAALIGGTMAAGVFRKKVHIGYLAAIVAALERRRRGQRGRRHHDHHDVDRRREPARGARCLCRRGRGAGRVRHPRRDPAAALRADHQGRDGRAPRRLDAASPSSPSILVAAIGANVVANLQLPGGARPFPGHRRRGLGGHPRSPRRCASPTGGCCPRRSRARSSCWRWSPAPR